MGVSTVALANGETFRAARVVGKTVLGLRADDELDVSHGLLVNSCGRGMRGAMVRVGLCQYQNESMKLRRNCSRTLVSLILDSRKACAAVAS